MIYNINNSDIEALESCIVCGSSDFLEISTLCNNDNNIFLATSCCQTCGHVFRSTRPKFSWFLDAWSKRVSDKEEIIIQQTADPIKESQRYDRYENLSKMLSNFVKNKNILDIGCGPGTGLVAFLNNGWDVTGVEPDPVRASIGFELHGLNIINSTIESFQEPKKYHVATLIHVLEHVHDPIRFMQQVADKVIDGGFIYVDVPELFNYVGGRGFTDSLYLEHMSNFTRYSLQHLGLNIDLTPVKTFITKTKPNGHDHMGILFQKKATQKEIDYSTNKEIEHAHGEYIKRGWDLNLKVLSPMHDKFYAEKYNDKVKEIYRNNTNIPLELSLNYWIDNITNVDSTCEVAEGIGLIYHSDKNKFKVTYK